MSKSVLRASFRLAVLAAVVVPTGVFQAQRLQKTVLSEHYTLALTPDLKTATFSGKETIDVTLSAATKTITLNSA